MQRFDLAYLASLAIPGLAMIWDFDDIVAESEADPLLVGLGAPILATTALVILLIALLPWYLASYRRVRFARWMLVIFFALGLVSVPDLLASEFSTLDAASLASLIFYAVALFFLFRPDSNAWFRGRVDPAVFE